MQIKSPVVAFLCTLMDEIPLGVLEEHAKAILDHIVQGGVAFEFDSHIQIHAAMDIAAMLLAAQEKINGEADVETSNRSSDAQGREGDATQGDRSEGG